MSGSGAQSASERLRGFSSVKEDDLPVISAIRMKREMAHGGGLHSLKNNTV